MTMKLLELWLVCEEEATYQQGTDTRSEVRQVHRERCFSRQDFSIEPGVPFQVTCQVTVPLTAMHSFQSAHNLVRWKLVVGGETVGWPAFERGFPIVVYPGSTTMQIELDAPLTRQTLLPAIRPIVTTAGASA